VSVESIFKCKLASCGWHFYGKTIWQNPKEGDILKAEDEKTKKHCHTIHILLLGKGRAKENWLLR